MAKFTGIFSALLTPFKKDGTINEQSVKQLIDFNLSKGLDGFYVGGSTGEGILLTIDERKQLFRASAEANAGRSTMIAHVGTIATDHAIEMAKYAEEMGYDAISAVAPYYYSFSYEAIKNYYLDIAHSVNIPMIIYNFPGANGFNFDKEKAEELIADPQFIGIKHTTSDMFKLQQFKTLSRDVYVYNGFDEMLLAGLAMGADGGIGSTYNLMGDKYVKLYNLFREGKIQEAQAIQNEVNEVICQLIKYGVFASEKQVLTEMGIDMGDCRKPWRPISEEGKKAMAKLAKSLM